MSFCLSVCLSVCLPVFMSVCLYVGKSVCLSFCLSVSLSVWSICLSDYPSACLYLLSIWPDDRIGAGEGLQGIQVCLSICLSLAICTFSPSGQTTGLEQERGCRLIFCRESKSFKAYTNTTIRREGATAIRDLKHNFKDFLLVDLYLLRTYTNGD